MTSALAPLAATPLLARADAFALQRIATPGGPVAYRQAGAWQSPHSAHSPDLPVTHVLLHGIGSASASWVLQLEAVAYRADIRVVAWDAPGYGGSAALSQAAPSAADYAQRLWDWLDALAAQAGAQGRPTAAVTLIGHSLGCLMATAAARMASARSTQQQVTRLLLLAPAQGYARAPAPERNSKLQDRLDTLARLGPAELGHARGAAMLSANATPEQVLFAQQVMAQIHPAGYTQAARLLAQGDLLTDLAQVTCPVAVASGSADGITPPAGCQAVAAHAGAPYTSIPGAGHACAVEAASAVSQWAGLVEAGLGTLQ